MIVKGTATREELIAMGADPDDADEIIRFREYLRDVLKPVKDIPAERLLEIAKYQLGQ